MLDKSLGEKRVRTDFNVSGSSVADSIKQKTAELINDLQAIRNDEAAKTYDKSVYAKNEISGEKFRLISIAQTTYEEAAMWAVKAATT